MRAQIHKRLLTNNDRLTYAEEDSVYGHVIDIEEDGGHDIGAKDDDNDGREVVVQVGHPLVHLINLSGEEEKGQET